MSPKKAKTNTCDFCRRPFAKGQSNYCTVACREKIIRVDPAVAQWTGYLVPLNASPQLDVAHAVGSPNQEGGRASACGIYGRFTYGLSRDFDAFDRLNNANCKRCQLALDAWATPEVKASA